MDLFSYWLPFARFLLGFVAVVFFLSGLDELFIDLNFIFRRLFRRLFVLPKHKRLSYGDRLAVPEQSIAIMVPAWDEAAVIRRMVEHTVRAVEYSNYHIFVGAYPNDPATQREVEEICQSFPNVHPTICLKDGPTNKADCLNWIYRSILRFERDHNVRFQIFVMEDSEDVVHPLCLKLFNYLIPSKDMVQLPVFPLEGNSLKRSSGHYIGEFAESHSKDLWVRERLAQGIPGAGVGCAFSRRAMRLAAHPSDRPFNIHSQTEDYEFGLRLHRDNLKGIFVSQRLPFRGSTRHHARVAEYVAVRGYFPPTFRQAVKQKTRWVLGITLQGWSNLGWRGGLWTRYMFFRDRKTLLTSQVNILGYVLGLTQFGLWLAESLTSDARRFPSLVPQGDMVWYLLAMDTAFVVWRIGWRFGSVYRLYGWGQAALSVPRLIWANIINACAVYRALYFYGRFRVTGTLPWEKTAHAFPEEPDEPWFAGERPNVSTRPVPPAVH
ncbi:MAG: glycosyl transferase family protein [Bryobacteraceae bacterium]